MTRLLSLLTAGGVLLGLASAAQASIVTPTQTLTFGPSRTEFNNATPNSLTFQLFDSNLGTLRSMTLGDSFGFSSTITVTNGAATSSNGNAQTIGTLALSASDSAINAVVNSLLNISGTVALDGFVSYSEEVAGTRRTYTLAPGGTANLFSNGTTAATSSTTTSAADLLPFIVAGGGTSTILANTFTQTSLTNNGGNTTASQVTTATGAFTISYTYDLAPTDVPEPASMALLGAGLLGAGLMRRRAK